MNITDFYYHSSDKDLARVIRSFHNSNVSFNMLCVGKQTTPREQNFCKKLLQGQVYNISPYDNEDAQIIMFNELSTMIRTNYERFNRK